MLVSQVVSPRTSEVVELAEPEPATGQVLVDVLAVGVCTSDLPAWLSGPQDGRPVRLGHEIVGRVVASGAATSRWRRGDVVTGLGGGGFATRAVLDEDALLPAPTGLLPEHSLGEPVACLEEALGRCRLEVGAHVAVVGLGFMGLGLVQLARTRAPGSLVGVDPNPAARARALELGLDKAYDPAELPGELTMDLVLEATGTPPGLETAGALVRPYGTLGVVGYHHAGTVPFDMRLWYKGATVVHGFSPDRGRTMRAMRDALDLVASRRFSYAPLITHRWSLDEVDAAYALMADRDATFVKSVLLPGGPTRPVE